MTVDNCSLCCIEFTCKVLSYFPIFHSKRVSRVKTGGFKCCQLYSSGLIVSFTMQKPLLIGYVIYISLLIHITADIA